MIDQLKQLESMVLKIGKRYQQAQHELTALKKQPTIDRSEHETLKAELASCSKERDELKNNLTDLDRRYQSLAEAHHLIGEEQDKYQQQIDDLKKLNAQLQEQNAALTEQKDKLLEKNRIAAEHTHVVLQRLTKIDKSEE